MQPRGSSILGHLGLLGGQSESALLPVGGGASCVLQEGARRRRILRAFAKVGCVCRKGWRCRLDCRSQSIVTSNGTNTTHLKRSGRVIKISEHASVGAEN